MWFNLLLVVCWLPWGYKVEWLSMSSAHSLSPVRLFVTMNRSKPGLPVHHQLPESTQTHVHSRWCHPAISSSVVPFSSCPSPSQHQGLFQPVSSSYEVVKVLECQLQHQSYQWTPRTDLLKDGLVGSPCSPRDSRVFSNTTVQKHQFFGAQLSSLSNSHIHTWPLEKP